MYIVWHNSPLVILIKCLKFNKIDHLNFFEKYGSKMTWKMIQEDFYFDCHGNHSSINISWVAQTSNNILVNRKGFQ